MFVVLFNCSSPSLSILGTQFSALLLLSGLRRAAFFRALQPPRLGERAKAQAQAANQRVRRITSPSPGAPLHPKAERCRVLSICKALAAGRRGGSPLASWCPPAPQGWDRAHGRWAARHSVRSPSPGGRGASGRLSLVTRVCHGAAPWAATQEMRGEEEAAQLFPCSLKHQYLCW